MGRVFSAGLLFIFLFITLPGTASPENNKHLTLPDIVIKGVYTPSYRDIEGVRLSLDIISVEKREPKLDVYGVGKELFERLRRKEATPKTPGCAYRHGVTSFFAKAFKGEEAYYKRGSYFYRKGEYQKALKNFEVVISVYPKSHLTAPAKYWKGECLFHMGKEEQAISVWKDCCENERGEFVDYACYSAGWLSLRRKSYSQSYSYLERVLRKFPKSPIYPESLILASLSLYREGRTKKAVDLLKKKLSSIAKDPSFPRASFALGIMEMDLRRFREAVSLFSSSLKSTNDPKLIASCLINRGFSKLELGDAQGGLLDFKDALRLTPPRKELNIALFGMLKANMLLGNHRETENILESLSGTYLHPIAVRIYAKYLAERGRFKDAIRVMEKLHAKFTGEDHFFLGYLFYMTGDAKTALVHYRKALSLNYKKDYTLYNMGLVLYRMGDLDKSYRALSEVDGNLRDKANLWRVNILLSWGRTEEAVDLSKKIKNLELKLKAASIIGEYLVKHGMWQRASLFLKPYLKFAEIDPYPCYLLAESMFNLERYGECVSIIEKLGTTRLSPEKVCTLKARAYLEWGKPSKALEVVKSCTKTRPYPTLLYLEGESLYRMGKYRESLGPYKKAISLGLGYPQKLDVYLKLYNAYMNIGMKEKALSTLLQGETSIKKEAPDLYPKIHYQITDFYYETKRYAYFLERAREFLRMFPRNPLADNVRVMLGDYYTSKGDIKNAELAYKPIIENKNNPSRFNISLSLANQLREDGKFKKALRYYELALSSSNKGIEEEALFGIVETLFSMGEYGRCIDESTRFLEAFPGSPKSFRVIYTKATSMINAKRKGGISLLETLASNPKTPRDVAVDSLKELVSIYLRRKNKKRAALHLNRLIPLLRGHEKAKYHLLKCELTMNPTECIRVSYLYSDRDVVSKALLYAAKAYYRRGDINSLKKVLKRIERVGKKKDILKIRQMVRRLEKSGGKR